MGFKVKGRATPVKAAAKLLGLAAGVVVFLIVIIQALASLTWHLSECGADAFAKLGSAVTAQWEAAGGVKVHQVAEWSESDGRRFKEAPMLKKRVLAGDLPPVAARLPQDPLVIIPPDQNGPYGGSWTRFATSPKDIGIYRYRIAYDGLVRWGPMGRNVLPNLAVKWRVADGGRTFTFWLRKGVRWSDGQPFTADDILFWYKCVLLNKELTPRVGPDFIRGGEVVRLEKLDDYTIQFRFKEPNGLFIKNLASDLSYDMVNYPAHYLKQFHPDYVPLKELQAKAHANRYDFWYQLFSDRIHWRNPEIPRLWAWRMIKPPPARPVVLERNPYYWKVDPEGNQLPYIDQITFDIFDPETINLKAINGEVGMQGRHMTFQNYQLFMTNRQKGGYRVLHWIDGGVGTLALCPNLNHQDPVLRKILGDSRFRIALSHAINREEINETLFFGVARGRQIAPPPVSRFYDKAYEEAYLKYDPDLANRLLDEVGLDKRDEDGFRLRPDGRPVALNLETSINVSGIPMLQLIAAHWRAVGIKADLKVMARQLFFTRRDALMHDVGVWPGAGVIIPVLDPRYFVPRSSASIQAIAYANWYCSGGKKGEKPPPDMLECLDLFEKIERTPDEGEQIRLFKKILDINRKNLWVIGTVGDYPQIFIVNEKYRNVPKSAVHAWVVRSPGNTAPECYAIGEGS